MTIDVAAFDALAARDAAKAGRRRAHAKGQRLERLVRHDLEAQGARVESAPKVVVWKRDVEAEEGGAAAGARRPLTVRHDFFGVWDMLAVMPDGRRCMVQVTTLENVAHKRRKILASGFPATADDRILAQERGRLFRELWGPDFRMPGRARMVAPMPRPPRARREYEF